VERVVVAPSGTLNQRLVGRWPGLAGSLSDVTRARLHIQLTFASRPGLNRALARHG
jgi:hypothetical protein